MSEILESALRLAAEGISVFPIVYGTKVPSKKSRGLYDATCNPATLRRWFGGTLKWNLAVRTGQVSRVWILDVDQPDALERLEAEHGALPSTRRSRSSRGEHYWFTTPVIPIPSSNGRIVKGVDIKSEGGYVVVPPSLHPDGVLYEWVDDIPVIEAPSWLLVLARKPEPKITAATSARAPILAHGGGAYAAAALANEALAVANTKEGNRNNQLNTAAFKVGTLIAGGHISPEAIENSLIEACNVNGLLREDGLSQCLATIRSGLRAGLQNPRTLRGAP